MKEEKILKIISKTLNDNSFLGEDCAFLDDLGITITQDSLVEDIHFSFKTTTPFELGQKLVAVNVSDAVTTLGEPKYIAVSVSMPSNKDFNSEKFIKELYKGINKACLQYSIKVVGGDITSSNKVYLSAVVISKKNPNVKISRGFIEASDYIYTTGLAGSSIAGYFALNNGIKTTKIIKQAHLIPVARKIEAEFLSEIISGKFAIMDTSDGFADSLYKMAKLSNVDIEIDFNSIPYDKNIKSIAKKVGKNWQDFVLWGGEDFELVFSSKEKIEHRNIFQIGHAIKKSKTPKILLNIDSKQIKITEKEYQNKAFNHFGNNLYK